MTDKKIKADSSPEDTAIEYISPRVGDAPFTLKVGDVLIKPVVQSNGSHIWPVPKSIHAQALRHSHIITGILVEK